MAQRILVVRRRYLGDIVLLGPVFANLRREWPDAHLAGLVEPAYAPVLAMNPDVNEIIALPASRLGWPAFLARLRRAGFTHVLDLDNNERTALLSRLTGARVRVALSHHGTRWRAAYTHEAYDPPSRHEKRSIVDYYLESLAPLGVPVVTREVRLVPRAAELASTARIVGRPLADAAPASASGRPTVVVHPGSRSNWRRWPAENFAAVCDRVQDELGAQVFVVGGPDDQQAIAEIAARAKSHVVTLRVALPIPQFTAFARQVDLLLCHDSGPMHLAAAVGTPVVALLGSQNPVLFAPQGPGHAVLQPPLPCTTCVAPDKCIPGDSYHNLCVRNITADRVFGAVKSALLDADERR